MIDRPNMPAGYRLQVFETIDSTNEELRRQVTNSVLPEGAVIWSKIQTAGKGRQNRVWVSEPGNMYCSVLFRPQCDMASAAQIGFLPVLAGYDALSELLGKNLPLRFKWPNDLLLERRKIAGALLEAAVGQNGVPQWVIAGCGINLNNHPAETRFPATNVAEATGQTIAVESLVTAYCRSLARWYDTWSEEGFAPVRRQWLAAAHMPEEPLTVATANENISGAFKDLDEGGSLVLETKEGSRRFAAGDVYFPDN